MYTGARLRLHHEFHSRRTNLPDWELKWSVRPFRNRAIAAKWHVCHFEPAGLETVCSPTPGFGRGAGEWCFLKEAEAPWK
jgi:hypothetical protein